jgi:segregation and condensation protein B
VLQARNEKVIQLIDAEKLKQILEAALLAADEPLTPEQFIKLFRDDEIDPENLRAEVKEALQLLETEAQGRGYELVRVASGYRYQVRQELSPWISRLWEEKPPRYSRALLETLALIAYRQPVTRGDIEEVRGVSVSQSIMRTLVERGWIRVVGQREVPGHPAMYGTTRAFLDYFNLKSLDQLPPLPEIRELIEPVIVEENLEYAERRAAAEEPAGGEETDAEAVLADEYAHTESRVQVADVGFDDDAAELVLDSAQQPDDLDQTMEDTDDLDQQPTAEVVQLPRVNR